MHSVFILLAVCEGMKIHASWVIYIHLSIKGNELLCNTSSPLLQYF